MKTKNFLDSTKIKYVHFIGIGGISMSGLAEILISQEFTISGSDAKLGNSIAKLKEMGVNLFEGHSKSNIQSQDLVVYTAAIKNDNPELLRAKELNIPVIERSTLLGEVMKNYTNSIAISGTHGKTTTTSMLTMAMIECNLEPTVHIGGRLEEIGGSTLIGGNEYFITEACEYVESFLEFNPNIAVILNIDADHLDYYKDIEHIKSSFTKFASKLPPEGSLVACIDDKNVKSILNNLSCNILSYSVSDSTANYFADNISFDKFGLPTFIVYKNSEKLSEIKLNVPGIHNISNALSCISICDSLNKDIAIIKQGLLRYKGTKRRFETKGFVDDITIIDDYAHHPVEIEATLLAAKNIAKSKIWCIFQPHTYTRTKTLLNEFSTCFKDADNIIISDIYSAREVDKGEIHSSTLADMVVKNGGNALYMSSFEDIVNHLNEKASKYDTIITMGAGNINEVGELFIEKKSQNK